MDPVEQVEVMSTLAYRVINTYAVQAYMEDTMMKATTIWKRVIKQGVERKKEEKAQEQMKEKGIDSVSAFISNQVILISIYRHRKYNQLLVNKMAGFMA